MSTNHTTHYDLCQWELTDPVIMSDFNADNAKLDAALHGLSEQLDGKVDTAALNGVSSAAARVYVGTYTGSGTSGSGKPTSLTFSSTLGREPKLLIVRAQDAHQAGLVMVRGMTASYYNFADSYNGQNNVHISWSGSTVSWYAENVEAQHNVSGQTYCYVAVG